MLIRGSGFIFPKYQPEISYLDRTQPIFDTSCKHILLKFLENPHKSPLQGSGSSRTMIFPIIAPTKMSKSGIGLTWWPIFEIQEKVQRVPFLVKYNHLKISWFYSEISWEFLDRITARALLEANSFFKVGLDEVYCRSSDSIWKGPGNFLIESRHFEVIRFRHFQESFK